MSAPISRTRSAWNATLFTHATGEEQDALGKMFGLPRPSTISRAAWRQALLAAGMAYRGEPSCTWFFLEGALSDYAIDLTVTLDPSRPNQLISPNAEFTQDLVGRFVRIPAYGLFRVEGPYAVSDYYYERLDLAPFSTSYWQAPNWGSIQAPEAVVASFLAFDVREDQRGYGQEYGDDSGTTKVYLYSDELQGVPPTFLQEGTTVEISAVDDTTDTFSTPILHGLVENQAINIAPTVDESAAVSVSSVDLGTNTITTSTNHNLSTDDPFIIWPGPGGENPEPLQSGQRYYAITVSPTELRAAEEPGGSAIDLTATFTAPVNINGFGEMPPLLDEATDYFAVTVTPFTFQVSETRNGSAVNLSGTGSLPLLVSYGRPYEVDGLGNVIPQVNGGIVMQDAFSSGNPEDPTAGPFPLFIASDETMYALREVFRNILPAGLKIKFIYIPPYNPPEGES